MTAVSGSVFTAAQFNTYVRDNLNETAPAKATAAGQIFVSTAANQIVARTVAADYISTQESTTATSYADMATTGPTVTATTSTAAIVALFCNSFHNTGGAAWMSYDVSGATTTGASDDKAIQLQSTGGQHVGATILHQGMTAGVNTFTAKYRVSASGTGTFSVRRLMVIPL